MKRFLVILSILLLGGAGYFTYEKWVKHARLTAWSFVPADAAIVLDSELIEDLTDLQRTNSWKRFSSANALDNLNEGLQFLDSINGDGGFSTVFQSVPTLVSAHKVSSTSIDYLFVFEIQHLAQNTFISAAIARLKQAGYRFKTRNYNGFKISEIGKGKQQLTYIFYKNFFLASFTPYLVEDAIRTIDDSEIRSFAELYKENRSGNVHINYNQLTNLIEAVSTQTIRFPVTSGSYELTIDSSFIHLSGISTPGESLKNHSVTPKNFEMATVVPSNTAAFYHISTSSITSFRDQQIEFLSTNPSIKRLNDSLSNALEYRPEQVLNLVDDEIGLAFLEESRPNELSKLFYLKVTDIPGSLAYFGQIAERTAYSRGDSIYSESYNESEIRFFPINDFPRTILGDIAQGFDRCFYINYKNYIVFSNDLQELKSLVSSTESEETWGKSLQMNDFLSETNAEANVSLFINLPRAWSLVSPYINEGWQAHFNTNEFAYKGIELSAFQFTWIDGQYYTSFTLSQPEKKPQIVSKIEADNSVTFANQVISKPHLVRTHAYSSFDLIVQDIANTIYYLNRSFSTLWTKNLEEPIVSEINEIDYYRNNKIQYLFATTSKVHILDRTGEYIPGYPKELPNGASIQHLNLIDYDRTKNYRIGITDSNGKVFLTNRDLRPFEGWDPIPYKRPAIEALRHARLGSKDIMISIQENGQINVVNRRARKMTGFPFNLRMDLDSHYYLSSSNSLGSSTLNVISKQGELTELNLEGIVIKRDQIIKNSADATFMLIPDRGEKSFVIVRREGNTYDVLDATGNLLFSKVYLSQAEVLVQYYQFGAGKDLIIFTDTANGSLYIYNRSGNLITGTPLKSEYEVGIFYSSSKKELQVYSTSGTNLEFYEFAY